MITIAYKIEVVGADKHKDQLNKIEQDLVKLTKAKSELTKKVREGAILTSKEQKEYADLNKGINTLKTSQKNLLKSRKQGVEMAKTTAGSIGRVNELLKVEKQGFSVVQ